MRQQIIDAVQQLFQSADTHNWRGVTQALANEVTLDFRSLSGNPPMTLTGRQVADAWAAFLPGFDRTQHLVTDFEVRQQDQSAAVHYRGRANHWLQGQCWTVAGTYDSTLQFNASRRQWEIIQHRFNLLEQSGNLHLPEEAGEVMRRRSWRDVVFKSAGDSLYGHLHLPPDFTETKSYPAVVVTGSWTTVKEQMPDGYARKLAAEGFVALTFDFRGYGQSDGEPRNYESPDKKSEDILAAVSYMKSLPFVRSARVGGVAICASAGYVIQAQARGAGFAALALIAPWLHNASIVQAVYGGESGVAARLSHADDARLHYQQTGDVQTVPAVSTTNDQAAMYGDFDYYLNPQRGAIAAWENKFAVMAWRDWLTFDPIALASRIDIPVQIIHSHAAAVPTGAELFLSGLNGSKTICWMEGVTQFDFYDQDPYVSEATQVSAKWLAPYV